jgi:hypothetical protein
MAPLNQTESVTRFAVALERYARKRSPLLTIPTNASVPAMAAVYWTGGGVYPDASAGATSATSTSATASRPN